MQPGYLLKAGQIKDQNERRFLADNIYIADTATVAESVSFQFEYMRILSN